MKRFLSALLCCLIPFPSFAADIVEPVIGVAPVMGAAPVKPIEMAPIIETQGLKPLATLPELKTVLIETSLPASARTASAQAAVAQAATSQAETARTIRTLSAGVNATLNNAGPIARAETGAAYETGSRLQAEMTGERLFEAPGSATPLVPQTQASATGGRSFLARPAGQEISESARAAFGGPNSPVPPRNNNGGGGNNSGDGGAGRIPAAARLVSFAVGLVPAVLIAWPLFSAGAILGGSLIVAAGLGSASLAFMGPTTPKALRSIPGALIVVLGAATVVSGAPSLAFGTMASGALTALSGWGLWRFARDEKEWQYQGANDLIGTFFGSVAATAFASLTVTHPVGAIANVARYVAIPFTLPLLARLPGWIGEGISSGLNALRVTLVDSVHVFGAIHRDTTWLKRLSAYSRAAVSKSSWNAVWLGLVVWLPILAVEAATFAIGAVWGAVLSTLRVVPAALWGASYGLTKDSKATKFFADWTRTSFLVSKVPFFNYFEKPLLSWANSESKLKSIPAALAIRALQLLWIPVSAIAAPVMVVVGLIRAAAKLGEPIPQGGVSPNLRLESDPLVNNQSVPDPKVIHTSGGKLLATAISLVPAYFIALPLLTLGSGPLTLGLTALLTASIVSMPLLTEFKSLPASLRGLPATALKFAGVMAAIGGARYALLGLPGTWPIIALGALAALSGYGMSALINKLQDPATKTWKLEEPEYIGGYVGALGVASALGVAFLSALGVLTGPLATAIMIGGGASSLLLLAHLPANLWEGVGFGLKSILTRIRSAYQPLNGWGHEQVSRNLSSWYRYWTRNNPWNAVFFILPWALQMLVKAADYISAFALGLAFGLVRAPANAAWAAAFKAKDGKLWGPNGRGTRFLAGFARSWQSWFDGRAGQEFFVANAIDKLAPALGDKNAQTGRPTLKALGALLASQFVTLGWLVWSVAGVALGWIPALFGGIKNALGAKTPSPNSWEDPDYPSFRGDDYARVPSLGLVKQRHEAELLAIDGVNGIGTGDGFIVVMFSSQQKYDAAKAGGKLPWSLDGYQVQYKVVGPIKAS